MLFISILFLSSYSVAAELAGAVIDRPGNGASPVDETANLLIVGASYAKNWQIEKIFQHSVINKGISGSETGSMLERFKADIQETKPRIVIIWGFINDIFRSEPGKLDQKIAKTRDNVTAMIELCRDSGITPIVATEVTITSKNTWTEKILGPVGKLLGKESYHEYINKHVIATNNWLKEYARENNIHVLDFEKVLAGESGERKREYAVDDGSHLSKQAYEALTKYMHRINI